MSLCLKQDWFTKMPLARWLLPAAVIASVVAGSVPIICLLCFGLVSSVPLRVIYLAVYGVLLFLFLWSYLCATILPPAKPPRMFNPCTEEGMRYCEICESFKPERAHHCRVCNKCILKYDHHCFWINNCTGHGNHKAFLLFIFYAILLLAGTSAVILVHLSIHAAESGWPWQSFKASEWTLLGESLILLTVLLLLCRFARAHLQRVARNQTEVEWLSNVRCYDFGCVYNFKEVFGNNCLLWLLPVQTTRGDGVNWRRNDRRDEV